jgi:hypothetical protein
VLLHRRAWTGVLSRGPKVDESTHPITVGLFRFAPRCFFGAAFDDILALCFLASPASISQLCAETF